MAQMQITEVKAGQFFKFRYRGNVYKLISFAKISGKITYLSRAGDKFSRKIKPSAMVYAYTINYNFF